MKKIKILIVTTTGLGKKEGISTIILDYFSRFDKDKFDIDIIASGSYSYDLVVEFQNAGINIRCLPSRKASVRKYIIAFYKLFKLQHYDVLYIHGSSEIMSIELVIAKLAGCKVRIAHSHNTTCDHKKADKILRPLFYILYTDAFACGQEAGKWLFGARPYQLIKNGRDIKEYKFDELKRAALRRQLEVHNEDLLIGHVGNFNRQKNQEYLINVFAELLQLNPNSWLYLMGDGKNKQKCMELADKLRISNRVIFTGSITNVPDMLQAMDVMVLPSLHEGLPLVVVEWQMSGLPCLVSDTVTNECVFTDLVYFMSLEEEYLKWANRIITLGKTDRLTNSKIAIDNAIEAGFDIELEASRLQEFFIERCDRG